MNPRRRRIAAAAAAVVALTGLTACQGDDDDQGKDKGPGDQQSSAAAAPGGKTADLSRYTSQKVSWNERSCPKSMRFITLTSTKTDCAKITAPKDYTDPGKGDITLMVSRTKSDAKDARVLFTNPGGPGAPAAQFGALVSQLSPLAATHDVIGIDPRGTGDSTSVSCEPTENPYDDNRQLTPQQMQTVQNAVKRSVNACTTRHGDLLPYITSDNTARDHDLVRQILGADKVDYYGVSAGTWLGARYATLFPSHVGRFVLDSNTDFTAAFSRTFELQPQAFQRRWDQQFMPWAARHDATYHLGATPTAVKTTYDKVRKAAFEKRLDVFTPSVVDNVLSHQLYKDDGFIGAAQLLGMLSDAADGDAEALNQAKRAVMAGAGSDDDDNRESTTFMAVTCNDTAWDKKPTRNADKARELGSKYPLVGWDQVESPCAYWPYTAPQTKVDVSKAPPMLMVQPEVDPATAYEGAMSAHQASPSTRMLAVDNQGEHGAVIASKNGCVTTATYDFLVEGRLIAQDGVCPALPLPGETQTYEVGGQVGGQKLPVVDKYKDKQPSLAAQVLKLLLDLLDDATTPSGPRT